MRTRACIAFLFVMSSYILPMQKSCSIGTTFIYSSFDFGETSNNLLHKTSLGLGLILEVQAQGNLYQGFLLCQHVIGLSNNYPASYYSNGEALTSNSEKVKSIMPSGLDFSRRHVKGFFGKIVKSCDIHGTLGSIGLTVSYDNLMLKPGKSGLLPIIGGIGSKEAFIESKECSLRCIGILISTSCKDAGALFRFKGWVSTSLNCTEEIVFTHSDTSSTLHYGREKFDVGRVFVTGISFTISLYSLNALSIIISTSAEILLFKNIGIHLSKINASVLNQFAWGGVFPNVYDTCLSVSIVYEN